MKIALAHYNSITVAEAMKLDGRGQLWTEKKDGVWATLEAADFTVVGEQMKDGSFWAFDVLSTFGQDVTQFPFHRRWGILQSCPIQSVPSGNGAEFLEAVLSNGGEGVVIADWFAPYGCGLTKVKRLETLDLLVSEKHTSKSSIHLTDAQGQDFGWCSCRSEFDNIRVGDWVEIAAFGRQSSGKLREPRFVRIRHDKATPLH